MSTRRKFIQSGLSGIAAITLLPSADVTAGTVDYKRQDKKLKLRFAIASDGHYGQAGTDFKGNYNNLIGWINQDHQKNHLDFMIMNGDLVHDRPDLLPELKREYLDKLKVPYHAVPGNHDFADAKIWKDVFGYEDNYLFDHGDIAVVLAHTADAKGKYTCPNNNFLKASFDKLQDKKIVFVVLHIPPVQWYPEEASIFLSCPETIELLHSYKNIKAVFHGHDHNLDGMRYTAKLPHFFDAHVGGNFGTVYRGYRIVEVDQNNAIYTYQVNATMSPLVNDTKLKAG